MSVEELLRPRIVCTEDYMDNIFEVGQQISLQWNKSFNEWEYVDCSRHILMSHFLQFKQFRKLEWWEYRKEDEMPEYLKIKYEYLEIIEKVNGYYFNKYGELFCFRNEQKTERININNSAAMPATEEEYLQHNTLVK